MTEKKHDTIYLYDLRTAINAQQLKQLTEYQPIRKRGVPANHKEGSDRYRITATISPQDESFKRKALSEAFKLIEPSSFCSTVPANSLIRFAT